MFTPEHERIDIQGWVVGRAEAAEIVAVSPTKLANWLDRYPLVPGGATGRGKRNLFNFSALTRIAFVNELTKADIDAKVACEMLEPFASPYAEMLHGRKIEGFPLAPGGFPAGTILLTPSAYTGLQPNLNRGSRVVVAVSTWLLFDDLWPRFKVTVLRDLRGYEPSHLEGALERFRVRMDEIRKSQSADRID